jgi:hypothetical protein
LQKSGTGNDGTQQSERQTFGEATSPKQLAQETSDSVPWKQATVGCKTELLQEIYSIFKGNGKCIIAAQKKPPKSAISRVKG